MKARMIEPAAGFVQVEIAPDFQNLDSIDGRIVVHYFDIDLESGRLKFAPFISVNVLFGSKMTADEADQWSKAFDLAADFCNRRYAPWTADTIYAVMVEVDKHIDQRRAAAREPQTAAKDKVQA